MPAFHLNRTDKVEDFKDGTTFPVPASHEGSVHNFNGPRSAVVAETLDEQGIKDVFRDRSLSRTAVRDNSDHVTKAQLEMLDTELSQMTFGDRKPDAFMQRDGFQNIYGIPNNLVPGMNRPNFPSTYKEVVTGHAKQPILLVDVPNDGWVPNWRELT